MDRSGGLPPDQSDHDARPPARILLVEDNPIIALDTEEILLGLGVGRVDAVGSNAAALTILATSTPEFALLDYNLGGETSQPVAQALEARGIRFAFATGYGEVDGVAADYDHKVAVLLKPYSADDLASVLRALRP